jgi:hypothetical protein
MCLVGSKNQITSGYGKGCDWIQDQVSVKLLLFNYHYLKQLIIPNNWFWSEYHSEHVQIHWTNYANLFHTKQRHVTWSNNVYEIWICKSHLSVTETEWSSRVGSYT